MRNRQLFILALFTLAALGSAAQTTVQVIPANPTSLDSVTLRVSRPAGFLSFIEAQWTGNQVRIDLTLDCTILCPSTTSEDVDLGHPFVGAPLPPGTYTYVIFFDGTLEASGSFVVTAAGSDVPTLSPTALLALCAVLAGAGWFYIGRQT